MKEIKVLEIHTSSSTGKNLLRFIGIVGLVKSK